MSLSYAWLEPPTCGPTSSQPRNATAATSALVAHLPGRPPANLTKPAQTKETWVGHLPDTDGQLPNAKCWDKPPPIIVPACPAVFRCPSSATTSNALPPRLA